MNAAVTSEIVRRLFVFFPVGVHLEMVKAYTGALKSLDPRDVAAAAEELIETRTSNRPPAVAAIKERALEAQTRRLQAERAASDRERQRALAPETRPTDEERAMQRAVAGYRREKRVFPGPQLIREILRDAGFRGASIERYVEGIR